MDILEGHYFSKMNRMLFVRRKKIEVISEWAGQTETQEVKERERRLMETRVRVEG